MTTARSRKVGDSASLGRLAQRRFENFRAFVLASAGGLGDVTIAACLSIEHRRAFLCDVFSFCLPGFWRCLEKSAHLTRPACTFSTHAWRAVALFDAPAILAALLRLLHMLHCSALAAYCAALSTYFA